MSSSQNLNHSEEVIDGLIILLINFSEGVGVFRVTVNPIAYKDRWTTKDCRSVNDPRPSFPSCKKFDEVEPT